MDIVAFIAQLNQLLQTADERAYLRGVCDLLRVHTRANVVLTNQNGKVLEEFFALCDNALKNKDENCELLLFINASGVALGNLCLRRAVPFDEGEILAANAALSVCTILLKNEEGQALTEKKRRMESVRAFINTLSFSELDASIHVLKALDGQTEGLLVAGHIADKLGFTRSVVTGALRKLEGAGLIETRSLGMKGTYIRVKDCLLTDELGKL